MPGPYYYWPGNPVEYAVQRSRTPYAAKPPVCVWQSRMPIRSHATRDRYLTGFPPAARMTAGRAVFSACRRE
ncbi:hypothetical protein [Candidatus Spongiihabitans sp.]|uniref:hypothetical protein n=1 Tax=Candidatus Spongiihabitans sp. TaxID=3101308 RepID=UPI003C7BE430